MVLLTLHTHDKEPFYINLNALCTIVPLENNPKCRAAITLMIGDSESVVATVESCDEILSKIAEAKQQMINSHSGEGIWIIS